MSKAYLNALSEEGSREDLIQWLFRLDEENDKLRDELNEYKYCYGSPPGRLDGN